MGFGRTPGDPDEGEVKGKEILAGLLGLSLFLVPTAEAKRAKAKGAAMKLNSSAFQEGAPIPFVHTCDGKNFSPALAWSEVPKGAKSLALICHDPDAPVGDFVHWLVWDLVAEGSGLREGASGKLPGGATEGRTDFGAVGYGGPCPPSGTHRYYFELYALDKVLGLKRGTGREELEEAMRGHILAQAKLMGRYQRTR
jgi:Raf kinase inhibitor-like YbhB/YbcL family protein